MAKKSAYKYRIVYYVGIVLTVACLVGAIYHLTLSNVASYFQTMQQQLVTSYVMFGVAGGLCFAQLVFAIIASATNHSAIGFQQWIVSFEVLIVFILIIAVLPLVFVMWIVELICDDISSKRSKRKASQQSQV